MCERKPLLIESGEIVHWRRDYLTKVRKARSEGKMIYYLHETWINEGATMLIIMHIESESGFVDGGLLTFVSKKIDYQEDMNSNVLEDWFSPMVDLIPNGSVIVMDNASYHSKKLEGVPTLGWLKKDIQSWMTEKNISFPKNSIKRELLEIIKLEVQKYRQVHKFRYRRNGKKT